MRSIDLITKRLGQMADREQAKAFAKKVDSTTRGASRGGFDRHIRFSSDGKRVNKRWMAGMSVGFQKLSAAPLTYSRQVAAATPLKPRKTAPESVWTDIGSTFKRGKDKPRSAGRSTRIRAAVPSMPGASLRTRLFYRGEV